MKKVLIVGRKNAGEKNDIVELVKGIKHHLPESFRIQNAFYEDLVLSIGNEQTRIEFLSADKWHSINSFQMIILLGWSHDKLYSDLASAIAQVANTLSIEVWNSELLSARSMTKISQLVRAVSAG